jgi:hypothetical protein
MATPTFTLISAVTVGAAGAASIDFTSIPSTYTDLCLDLSLRTNRAAVDDFLVLAINGSTSTFTYKALEGSGAAASSYSGTTGRTGATDGNSATASTFSSSQFYFPNYAGSTNKSYSIESVAETNVATAYMTMLGGLWSTTSAINQLTITGGLSSGFVQYSTAYLYGVSKS